MSEDRTYIATEVCPHCESEIEMRWNTDTMGFRAFCPVCGKRLMLCDECMHSGPDGSYTGFCDYDGGTDTCQHNRLEDTDMNKTPFVIHAEIEVRMTQEDVDDIMCTALEGGITYWADMVKVEGEYLGEYASEQISRGGKLKIHLDEPFDEDDTEWYTLDMKSFADGVAKWLENGCHVAVEDNRLDTGDIDAKDADCIIQYALFGELVFG